MRRGLRRTILMLAAIAAVTIVAAAPASAEELVVNGGFETGDFEGWTVQNQPGGGGDWFVYSGDVSPEDDETYDGTPTGQSGLSIPPPPVGEFAATTDQEDPGAHILYQDVALPAGTTCSLSMIAYYQSAAAIVSPDTLDYTVGPNQQYRIDVMDPAAPLDSVDAGILQTLLHTQTGDPQSMEPTELTADLSAYAGQTVRLRFAETDNQLFFQGSVDAVSVDCTVPAPIVLEPSFTG